MRWLWAVFGAVVGWLLDDGDALGLFAGLAVGGLSVKLFALQRRMAAAEGELALLRRASSPARESFRPETSGAEAARPERHEPARPEPISTGATTASASARTREAQPPPPTTTTSTTTTTLPSTAPTAPTAPAAPAAPRGPSSLDRAMAAAKRWLTEGNVPVKIGVLVLFIGVAAALRFAAAEGYLRLPIGWRLGLIAASALAALAFGWRERRRRRPFALSLQGGALGVLLLTIFAAFRLYGLLPAPVAFGFTLLLVAGAALLAVLQRTMALAVLGFLGGYLAPVLLSSGDGDPLALFSFYAVLNAAVLAISWRQRWRLLNLIGFVFTFGVGAFWFSQAYRPELYWRVQPFLALFFLFYVAIGLLFVIRPRRADAVRPWVDGSLVFGTPLVAFPMQAKLLEDRPMALAFCALAVAGVYLGLLLWLRRRSARHRLLSDAYAALALGFATLAVPLAFSATVTGSLWALEGAGLAWLGLRQTRLLPRLAGLALQVFAAVAYLRGLLTATVDADDLLVLNGLWLGAALLGVAGFTLSWLHDRLRPQPVLSTLLLLWGVGWWTLAGLTQLDLAARRGDDVDVWIFGLAYLGVSALAAGALRRVLGWPRIGWAVAPWALLGLPVVAAGVGAFDSSWVAPTWLAYLAALASGLWLNRRDAGRDLDVAHGLALWTASLAVSAHLVEWSDGPRGLGSGWVALAVAAPTALLSLGLWRRPAHVAWPRAEAFGAGLARWLWFAPALGMLAVWWLAAVVDSGDADPLTYVPLLNPLELGLVGVTALLWGFGRERLPRIVLGGLPVAVTAAIFALVTAATLRAVHHLHGESWSPAIFESGFAQASLTVAWSLLGVAAWIVGSRRRRRAVWLAGAGLMALVLVKLIAVDREFMGNIAGIVSFIAVGLLVVAVGYLAPSPPSEEDSP